MADKWKMEIYDRKSKRWRDYGAPCADFHRVYKDAAESCERGLKVRVTKIADGLRIDLDGQNVTFTAPETPEQKQQEGEAPELLRRAQAAGCTFSAPLACEYCTEKQCPVTVIDMQKLDQEEAE